jgi:hypothetical protein
VTKLLQCLRDELVRRDYAATTTRSYFQIVDARTESVPSDLPVTAESGQILICDHVPFDDSAKHRPLI